MTAYERVVLSRKTRTDAGWREINLWLPPHAALALEEISQRLDFKGIKKTQNEIIVDAIMRKDFG